MSMAEKIYDKALALPNSAQLVVLELVEELSQRYPAADQSPPPLTMQEAAEVRGKLAAWEEDWNAPGMEVYDRP